MPPGPIDGSCLASPTAISFAPERSTSSVRASIRLWSTIPASSRITVVSRPRRTLPVFARAASASTVNVLPASAGLSAPRRSAVDPDTATPITSRPAVCSARAAASITTPFPVPAGPISTARRSGPVMVSSACRCSTDSGAAMRSATSLPAAALARSPVSRPAAADRATARRSIASSRARTVSVVIRPPSRVRIRRSPTISRVTAIASSGPSSPADCSSATARSSPASNTASRSGASPQHAPQETAPAPPGRTCRLDAPLHPHRTCDAPVRAHARFRSPRVVSSLARRFSSAMSRISPPSGARPCLARNRSTALAISR